MEFYIKKVVLWAKKDGLPPRELTFKNDEINVLTGGSKRGKSSILSIIDYCLGSDQCSIPVLTIRDATAWFGVLVSTPNGEKLIARREPGSQVSTGEMFVLEGKEVAVPPKIEGGNYTVDTVKELLNAMAALPSFPIAPEAMTPGFRGRPSFRDMLAFCFQPQNVIANPNILFFKADLQENREKLRNVFPFALNALTPELLEKRAELDMLRRDLRIKERELKASKEVSERWLGEVRTWVAKSKELGLLDSGVVETQPPELLLSALRGVVKQSSRDARMQTEDLQRAVAGLLELQNEESEIASELSVARRRLSELEQFSASIDGYQVSLQTQRERLEVSDWLRKRPAQECAMCGSLSEPAVAVLERFYVALKESESSASQVQPIPFNLQRERLELGQKVRILTERLTVIRTRIREQAQSSEGSRRAQLQLSEIDRFIGSLEQALRALQASHEDENLDAEVAALRERVHILSQQISEANVREKIARAIQKISVESSKIVPNLDSERPDDNVVLVPDELTLKIQGQNRSDYLWEIGSGANWLTYHLATQLALHKFFFSLEHSPVPGFLVLDQPSQVYFPKGWESPPDGENIFEDEDVKAVRRIYEALAIEAQNLKGKLQIIVLDHPGQELWAGIDSVNIVEEWRGDSKLIPSNWLD